MFSWEYLISITHESHGMTLNVHFPNIKVKSWLTMSDNKSGYRFVFSLFHSKLVTRLPSIVKYISKNNCYNSSKRIRKYCINQHLMKKFIFDVSDNSINSSENSLWDTDVQFSKAFT